MMAEDENAEEQKLRKAMMKRLREAQVEQQKREIARRYMSPEAYERLMNVRVSNYELYSQVLDLIIAMAQNNRITVLTDEQLRSLLVKFTARPEPTIEYKHK